MADEVRVLRDADFRVGRGRRLTRAMRDADNEEMKLAPQRLYISKLRAGSVIIDVLVDAQGWTGERVFVLVLHSVMNSAKGTRPSHV